MKNKNVLILNKDYQPLKIVNWQSAFVKLCSGAYDVLEFSDEVVHSGHAEHKIPSVMILKNYVNAFPKQNKGKRGVKKKYVIYRDNQQCQYCGVTFPINSLTVDHITPKSKGGRLEYSNLVASCKRCNSKKGDRSCLDSGMFPINHPRDITRFDVFRFMFMNVSKAEKSWEPYFKHFI